ncbi:lysosomal acid phosphatase-like [Diachasmimorpha longicaudata]|uniref:lysosomal acid phosphatase-like n=1 Tax=Diachasmimorpha longicaudata TaxID=58733 RepID=UPI0030B89AE0
MDSSRSFWVQNCRSGRRGMCFTVVLLGIIVGSTLLAYAAFAPKKNHHSIQQIAIIFRHGARNPTETYQKDPHIDHKWPDGWGALTKEGMLQLYQQGKWLRDQYEFVIGNKYYSKTTLVRSSYAERCIMSAQALLAALFRPQPEDYFIPDLPWRPVPVTAIPRDQDKLITVKHVCPKLDEALKEAYVNESRKSGTAMAPYYAALSYHTGQHIETITDVEFLYNTLEIEAQRGLELPEWTKQFYNDTMREIAARSLAIFTSNTLQRRLRGGPLLKEILDNMMRARNDQHERKLYLYSAHDITLVNVMRAMGFTEELFKPDYGAALIFELVLSEDMEEGEHDLEVKVKYLNNTNTDEATPISIPGCKEPCKLLNLSHAWQDVLPTDWDSECKV